MVAGVVVEEEEVEEVEVEACCCPREERVFEAKRLRRLLPLMPPGKPPVIAELG
jgi:hypothetical protein